jgi:hypothetical protein
MLGERMKNRTAKITIAVAIVCVISIFMLIRFYGAQLGGAGFFAEFMYPGIISSDSFLRSIKNPQRYDAYSAYGKLGKRKTLIAHDIAIEHLKSEDDYLWLNAALYLGRIDEPCSIPYLIKALRHTAWRSDKEKQALLVNLTGVDYGVDFLKWHSWWMEQHPGSTINWESSLGHQPRIKKIIEP